MSGLNSFLLESVEGGATRGRYSIIGCEPDLIWRANGGNAEINRAPQSDPHAFAPSPLPALAALRALLAESAIVLPPELPPMAAGIFGYMGYDTVQTDRASAERQARSARFAPCHPGATNADRDLRCG